MVTSLALVVGCARATTPVPVIEPTPAGEPAAGANERKVTTYTVRLGSAWFTARGEWLGVTPKDAERRDAVISDSIPPPDFWDRQTATEAAALWGGLCNDCHGGRRRVSTAKEIPPPAPDWPTKQAFFFGRPRLPGAEFRTIFGGGPPRGEVPSEMPAWGRKLSREQIWALVYFIAWESGGVEGAFPPGLFPKRSDEPTGGDPEGSVRVR